MFQLMILLLERSLRNRAANTTRNAKRMSPI
jgi:hypothetical protein